MVLGRLVLPRWSVFPSAPHTGQFSVPGVSLPVSLLPVGPLRPPERLHDILASEVLDAGQRHRAAGMWCTGYSVEGALLAPSPFVPEQGHCLNCGEPTHGSHSLSVSRTVCTALRHAYVARPCTHCVPELGHCAPELAHCTSRTVLHTPAAFPWAATAGQRPSARLPTQAGPRAGPIATDRVGAAGSSTPRGASASRTVNGSPSPPASSRTQLLPRGIGIGIAASRSFGTNHWNCCLADRTSTDYTPLPRQLHLSEDLFARDKEVLLLG